MTSWRDIMTSPDKEDMTWEGHQHSDVNYALGLGLELGLGHIMGGSFLEYFINLIDPKFLYEVVTLFPDKTMKFDFDLD